MSKIAQNLKLIEERIRNACAKRIPELQHIEPRLVAVSKTKPKQLVIEAYQSGQHHFGENYVKELYDKANDEVINQCPDIKWHFIGHLQRSNVKKVLAVPNLFIIETVDSEKIATALNNGFESLFKNSDKQLNVFVQVNTSGEEAKSGCKPEDALSLVQFIRENCSYLKVLGLMTIGRFDNYDPVEGINPDFKTLIDCRTKVCENIGVNQNDFELSMGMSGDFEHAIEVGSTNVRVGSAIFGERG